MWRGSFIKLKGTEETVSVYAFINVDKSESCHRLLRRWIKYLVIPTCIFLPLEADSPLGCGLGRLVVGPLVSGHLPWGLGPLTRLVRELVDELWTNEKRVLGHIDQ